MPRYTAVLFGVLALAIFALACDGGGPGGATVGPGETPTLAPGETPTPEASPTETAAASPTGEASPTATPTPSSEGTPVLSPADLSQYQGQEIGEEDCIFNPGTALVDCGARGSYAPNPVPTGEDIACGVLIVQDQPVALRCNIQEPLTTIYYTIIQ